MKVEVKFYHLKENGKYYNILDISEQINSLTGEKYIHMIPENIDTFIPPIKKSFIEKIEIVM